MMASQLIFNLRGVSPGGNPEKVLTGTLLWLKSDTVEEEASQSVSASHGSLCATFKLRRSKPEEVTRVRSKCHEKET